MFAYLDCFSGVSGDKFLGALVGAGVSVDDLRERLASLGLPGWTIDPSAVRRAGLAGTLVSVGVDDDQPSRTWRDIQAMISGSSLEDAVKRRSLAAFGALAEAEARAHGVEVADVHFHEVGAVDSIVDIVGTAIGLELLGIETIWSSPVCVGFGTVRTRHGILPVPAPATAELLRGIPTYAGEVEGEMTTPTGAALLKTFVDRFAPMPPGTAVAEGWGAGSRETPVANLLRLTLAEGVETGSPLEQVAVLATTVDHISAEHLAAAVDILLDLGALDAWTRPVHMKKDRLGAELTVIARLADAARLSDAVMLHTGTLGVRRTLTWRAVADRELLCVPTSLGDVRVKVSGEGEGRRVRPENDDVVAIARATGRPVDTVARQLTAEATDALRGSD
jgi:pyridinium-3,5-bisthiocarboxylic acid mononucleotide nickel chelatase